MPEEVSAPQVTEPPQDVVPSTIKKISFLARIKLWYQKNPKRNLTLSLIGVFFLLGVGSYIVLSYEEDGSLVGIKQKEKKQVDALVVLRTDPLANAQKIALDKKITFTFNEEVKPHILEHNFEITPKVQGKFSKGKILNEVVFTPSSSFSPGSYVSVKLNSKLKSVNNIPLAGDFLLSFQTGFDENKVFFAGSGLRLLSLEENTEAQLKLQIGSAVGGSVEANIYQAQTSDLLTDFVYQKKTESTGYVSEIYSNKVNTSNLKLVDSQKNLSNNATMKYKSGNGIYYIQAINAKKEEVGSIWLVFNSKGLLLRQDDQSVLVGGQDLRGGKLESEITYTLYNLEAKQTVLGTGSVLSTTTADLFYPKRLDMAIGTYEDEVIVVPLSLPQSQAEISVFGNLSSENRIFLTTDKSIYKKGETIHYRGVLRKDNDSLYNLSNKKESVKIKASKYLNNEYVETLNQTVVVKDGGIFDGEFIANDNFFGESQYIQAEVVGETNSNSPNSYAYFDVIDYKKPNFNLIVSTDKAEYFSGEKVQATIIGLTTDGKPLSDTEVFYDFTTSSFSESDKTSFNENFNIGEMGMCGGPGDLESDDYYISTITEKSPKVKLDVNGKATVTIDTDKFESKTSQNLVVVALRKDGNNKEVFGAAKSVVYQGDIKILIRQRNSYYLQGEDLITSFYSESRNGEKQANKRFNYSLIFTNYDQGLQKTTEEVLSTDNVETNENGVGAIKKKLNFSKFGSYLLRISGTDSLDRVVEATSYFSLGENTEENQIQRYSWSGDPSATQLSIISQKNSYLVGDTAEVTVDSPEDIRALMTLERGRIYKSEWIDLKKGENTLNIDIVDNYSPSITTVFTFFLNGRYYTEGLVLNVPAMHKILNVSIKPEKETFTPNEKAKLNIVVTDKNGKGVSSVLSASVVDKSFASVSRQVFPSIHSAFYFHRKRTTNASSSLTAIGGYSGFGRFSGAPASELTEKTAESLYWNSYIKTDSAGKATIEVPLNAIETTWRVLVYGSDNNTNLGQNYLDLKVSTP